MTPPPRPRLSTPSQTIAFLRSPFELLERGRAECGDVFELSILGLGRWTFVSRPEHLKTVFKAPTDVLAAGAVNGKQVGFMLGLDTTFALDGDAHLARRRMVHPLFNGRSVLAWVDVMREATDEMRAGWAAGESFSFLDAAHGLSLRILMRVMFGGGTPPERVDELGSLFGRFSHRGLRSPLMAVPPLQIDLGAWSPWGRILRLRAEVRDAFRAELERRMEMDPDFDEPPDVLSQLVRARTRDGEGLELDVLLQEVLTLLFAGHETTGNILAWTLECVVRRPEILDRIREELDEVVGDADVGAEHVAGLELVAAVVQESVRFRPIAPMAGIRLVAQPFSVGGFDLEPGTLVAQCFPAVCRNPDVFPDADRFSPEHFYRRKLAPFQWNPFGGGTRMCTGKGFAEVELSVVLATLFRSTDFELAQTSVEPVRQGMFFSPSEGLRVRARPRAEATS